MPTPDQLYQALISSIESQCNDDFCEEMDYKLMDDNPAVDPNLKECIKRLGNIYRLTHAFNREHTCYHVHDAWRQPVLDLVAKVKPVVETASMEVKHAS